MKRVVLLLVICLCAYSYAKVVTGRTDVNVAERDVAEDSRVQETTKLEFYPTISYQGLLKDSEGKLIADGSYSLTFSVYDAEDSKEKIWKEVQTVEIKNGIVNCYVGAVEKLNLPFDKQYWLSVSIGEEELPRMIMGGTPYSLHARRIAEDAIVAGKNISVTKAEDGKLRISGSGDLKNGDGTIYNLYDGGTGGLRMPSCNTTVGDSAIAVGKGTNASGNSSIASGYHTNASGYYSTALGYKSEATGNYSTALGYMNSASGMFSFSLGSCNKSTGQGSASFGYLTESNGIYSYTFGRSVKTSAANCFAIGSNFENVGADSLPQSFMVGFNDGSQIKEKSQLFVNQKYVCIGYTHSDIKDSILTSSIPYSSLLVKETIYAKNLELKTSAWADYVFKKDYKLKPLSEVEEHIKNTGCLPGVISEDEALRKGVNVGDIQVKFLEKIEELTLYIIEQDKKIKDLQNKIK